MHERTPSIRERTPGAVRASWTASPWAKAVAVIVLAALFMAFVGAFGSQRAPLPTRLAYWLAAMAGGSVLGWALHEFAMRIDFLADRLLARMAVVAVAMSVPYTAAVWALSRWAFGAEAFGNLPPVPAMVRMFPSVLLVSTAMTALNLMAVRRPRETHAAAAGAPPSRFLDRLPAKLLGADLYAVEAQDHYLRLHTSRGSDLILMRLADALGELEGLEGAQTHRSWWVAKDAVASARRGDGRAVLVLKSGAEAPVSRSYARALRQAGWF